MLFLYVLDITDEGNSVEQGNIRADNVQQARDLLAPHLKKVYGSGNIPVRFHTVKDSTENGVMQLFDGHVDLPVCF